MLLKGVVIADPRRDTAQLVADQCDRLAQGRLVAGTGDELLAAVQEIQPEMVVVSLELRRPGALEVIKSIQQTRPDTFLIVTYRELALPMVEKLDRLGVHDLVGHPIDLTHIYRAASRHFGRGFRRHDRHTVSLEVFRVDGVLVGRTLDLSEGGMRMQSFHAVSPEDSLLVELALPDEPRRLRVRCQILHAEGQSPAALTVRVQFEKLRGPEHERLVRYLASLP